jgi:hypothetical protein
LVALSLTEPLNASPRMYALVSFHSLTTVLVILASVLCPNSAGW